MTQYLLSHCFDVLERLVVCYRINNDKALAVPDVEIPHRSKLLGPCSVEDLQHRRGTVHLDLLAIEVFDCWVILFHKAASHKLHSEGTLANTSRAKDNNFELSHFEYLLLLMMPRVGKGEASTMLSTLAWAVP